MSLVSIVRCESYDLAVVREAVRACLRALPEVKALLRTGRRVLLKPNLLSASAVVERAVNTHPAVIRAAAEVCRRDYGCDVAIGDSCGSLAPGSTQRALESTGVPEICDALGATPLDFDRCASTTLDVRQGQVLKRLTVARPALEADVLFSLPKFKTHNLTLLTGGVKNMMGAVPGKGKKDMHVIAPKPALFARALVDLYGVVRPHLSLMDAVVGMEGNGPNAGTPRRVGLLMAATDAVALDAVAAAIMGCGQGEVLAGQPCAQHHVGPDADRARRLGFQLLRQRHRVRAGRPLRPMRRVRAQLSHWRASHRERPRSLRRGPMHRLLLLRRDVQARCDRHEAAAGRQARAPSRCPYAQNVIELRSK